MSSQALCVKLSLSYLVLSVSIELLRNGEQAFSMCVHPCPRYLMLESAGCVHCDVLPSRTAPIPPGVLSQWGRSGSRSPGLWSRCCRGSAEVTVLGFANRSVSGVRDGHSLISAFTRPVQCLLAGLGSTRCGFFRPDRGTDTLYDSEELDVVSVKSMHEILRIRHLSLVLMRSVLRM